MQAYELKVARDESVARMKQSVIRGGVHDCMHTPDFVSLHPGYGSALDRGQVRVASGLEKTEI